MPCQQCNGITSPVGVGAGGGRLRWCTWCGSIVNGAKTSSPELMDAAAELVRQLEAAPPASILPTVQQAIDAVRVILAG